MARAQETALARFYSLSKVHEAGTALQTIVSLKGTPTYGLANWLFWRLKVLTSDSDNTVHRILAKLKGNLEVEAAELLLRSKYDETENGLGHAQVIQIPKFCHRTYLTFDRTIYERGKGNPMGSPTSESLVCQHHSKKFWARHMDDPFVLIKRNQMITSKERLKSIFPDIQFTMEEENNYLIFLDVLVYHKDCVAHRPRLHVSDKCDASADLREKPTNQLQARLRKGAILPC
ncbi:unnamed protein product [Schistocephalus solidus]|uniref:Helitron_like_N domain-containing protein n=1 Tax=Schistocephalus solidus TaxID=70667 RepID=A0A183TE41_SCHSO|nr:unnamed protein product [Schistocephalus solidus]